MTEFVFDECFNDKRVFEACRQQAACTPARYPKRLQGAKDPEMLPEILSGRATLVTLDVNIVEENESFIPRINSGIIIVRSRVIKRLMTTRCGGELLSRFKVNFPAWAEQNWSCICLEISEEGAVFSSAYERRTSTRIDINYNSPDFSDQCIAAIASVRRVRQVSTS